MAGRKSSKRNQRSRIATARRRRVLGAGTTAGAFLAFGMTPLAAAPAAHADEFDVIIDPIINSILGSVPNSITGLDALLGIDPTAGSDQYRGCCEPDRAARNILGIDLAVPANDAAASSADALAAAPAADPSLADLFQTEFYEPLHAADQAWINSPLGEEFDNAINPLFATNDFCGLICNGTPGTEADPTGGNGGLFFGDGGAGWTSTEADGGTITTGTAALTTTSTLVGLPGTPGQQSPPMDTATADRSTPNPSDYRVTD